MVGKIEARVCGMCNGTGLIDPNKSTGFASLIYTRKIKCPECRGVIWIIKDE